MFLKRIAMVGALAAASFAFCLSGCSTTGQATSVEQARPQAMTGETQEGKTGGVKKVGYGKKAYRSMP